MRRFTIAPDRIAGGHVTFDREESRHLSRVLRLRPGDTVIAADGAGRDYTVRVETVGEIATGTVLGVATRDVESPLRLTLVQSVPKGDKMEAIVRAATELGAARVVPILTERTIVSLEPARWRERARRWQRVAKEAAKQCGRAVVPPVDAPHPLADFLALEEPADLRLCFWEGAATIPGEGGARASARGAGGRALAARSRRCPRSRVDGRRRGAAHSADGDGRARDHRHPPEQIRRHELSALLSRGPRARITPRVA